MLFVPQQFPGYSRFAVALPGMDAPNYRFNHGNACQDHCFMKHQAFWLAVVSGSTLNRRFGF
jgi:hypothetical protein